MNEQKIELIDMAILALASIFVIMVSVYVHDTLNEPDPIPIIIKAPEANTYMTYTKNPSTRFYVVNS